MTKDKKIPDSENDDHDQLMWLGKLSNFTQAQKDFNEALGKHKDAIARVKEIEGYLEIANQAYYHEIIPEQNKQRDLEKQRVEMMSVIYLDEVVKLGKQQKEVLRQLILDECFKYLDNDRTFYFEIIKQIETTAERNNRIALKRKTEKQIKEQFGVDVDIDELNKTSFATDEEREQHKEKFREFFEKYHERQTEFENDFFENTGNRRERKKSKAQQEKEKKLAEAEKLLNTDINKLFKDLAKLIHPDREQDPVLREKKEALMKELSNARDNMNIADILSIKMHVDELIPNNNSTTNFNDETIKRFVSIIKSKINELENTISQKLYSHPLFEEFNVRNVTADAIESFIRKEVKSIKFVTNAHEIEVEELANNPKYIKTLIDDYADRMDEEGWR